MTELRSAPASGMTNEPTLCRVLVTAWLKAGDNAPGCVHPNWDDPQYYYKLTASPLAGQRNDTEGGVSLNSIS